MPHRDDPAVFHAPAFEVGEVATFGRNASKLAYERQRAQTQQVVQVQARERARMKETTMTDADRRRLLGSSVLGQEVLRHEQMQRAATFAKGSKYTREELAKLTPKDFADPVRLEYPILDQDDLDAAADAMLESAKVPMLFDKEKDAAMRSQIRAIAQRRGGPDAAVSGHGPPAYRGRREHRTRLPGASSVRYASI